MMKYIMMGFLLFTIACKRKVTEKIYYPNGKLNYSLQKGNDITKIIFFDENQKPAMKFNFYKDHFKGSLTYPKNPNLPFKDSIQIDSVEGPYFYGTEYVFFEGNVQRVGSYRYKRNLDFRKSLQSVQPIGIHYSFDLKGNIIGKDNYKIQNDSLYRTKIDL